MLSSYVPAVSRGGPLELMEPMERQTPGGIVVREWPGSCQLLDLGTLERDQIHVWHASLAAHPFDPEASITLLAPDELPRMGRFHFEKDRLNFLFCRSMLRVLLASYLDTPPAELHFAYSAHGKPSLAVPSGNLQFNLSHSRDLIVVALCQRRRIGVDVEHIRRNLDVHDIAGRFFSPAEQQELRQLPEAFRYEAFFHCWTRKEAFVKARGEGLSCPLESFDVSVAPGKELVSLTTRPDGSESRKWVVRSLNLFAGYAAALAVEVGDE